MKVQNKQYRFYKDHQGFINNDGDKNFEANITLEFYRKVHGPCSIMSDATSLACFNNLPLEKEGEKYYTFAGQEYIDSRKETAVHILEVQKRIQQFVIKINESNIFGTSAIFNNTLFDMIRFLGISKNLDVQVQTILDNSRRYKGVPPKIELFERALGHDQSKLYTPEVAYFDAFTSLLPKLKFGSNEYKESLAALGEGLQHHYKNNSHHPEYYENGIDGMNIYDVAEMLCDWKAASYRSANQDISFYDGIVKYQKERFKISDELMKVFENTIKILNW